jgi:hypothetical protein
VNAIASRKHSFLSAAKQSIVGISVDPTFRDSVFTEAFDNQDPEEDDIAAEIDKIIYHDNKSED